MTTPEWPHGSDHLALAVQHFVELTWISSRKIGLGNRDAIEGTAGQQYRAHVAANVNPQVLLVSMENADMEPQGVAKDM